jgi:predicted PurR-regulated permease PerM
MVVAIVVVVVVVVVVLVVVVVVVVVVVRQEHRIIRKLEMHRSLVLSKRTVRFYMPLSLQIFMPQKLTTPWSQLAQIMLSLHTVHNHMLQKTKNLTSYDLSKKQLTA